MSETLRPYREGDSVISTRCLVSDPLPGGGVRVEIPVATRGTVTGFDPAGGTAPYTVAFEAGDGGFVEINVSALDIGRVVSHRPIVPLLPDGVLSAAYAAPRPQPYEPTQRYPHRLCMPLHTVLVIEFLMAYAIVLSREPELTLALMTLVAGAVYGHQLLVYREFTWVPIILQTYILCEDEELVVDPEKAWQAAVADVAVVLLTGSLLGHYLAFLIGGGWPNVVLASVHIVLVGLVWMTKLVIHEKAARIRPKIN
jgi:hypothetical protein